MRRAQFFLVLAYSLDVCAQLLAHSNGNLPDCADSCDALNSAVKVCNGLHSTSLTTWSCFCQTFWTASDGSITTSCAQSCTNPSDNVGISTWYTNNCGSDNGASEHGGHISRSSTTDTTITTIGKATGTTSSSAASTATTGTTPNGKTDHGHNSPKAASSSEGLSEGAWAGIGIAIAIFCLAALILVWFVLRQRRTRLKHKNEHAKPYLDDKAELDVTTAKRGELNHGNNPEIAELDGQDRTLELDSGNGLYELPVDERSSEMRDVISLRSAER